MGCICAKPKSNNAGQSKPSSGRHSNGSARMDEIAHKDSRSQFADDGLIRRSHPMQGQPEARMRLVNIPKHLEGEQVAAGWPGWLAAVAGEAIKGWIPRRADSFEKLDKIGQGTYSNVYKARDLETGKVVALKKVRFDNLEPESVKFMAREIQILRRLNHPNVVSLEGLVTSRMSCSLYLVMEYMEHDLAGLAACPGIVFTEPQVKCYLQQLLRGLDHCHSRDVLHRDIKGSNLLIDNSGVLKIADFGLATFYHPDQRQPLTSRVVTLWYRPPELLLGATEYDVAVDLWSTGCILAELLAGKPIMPGRTEVEQLHKIFKLCGSPSEEYWKKSKLPHATIFKPQQPYNRCISETFKDFPNSALTLLETLLAIEPAERRAACEALKSDFFTTRPYPCDPGSLPKYPPSKELDAKMRDEEARRLRSSRQGPLEGRRHGSRERSGRVLGAPDANAELQISVQKRRLNPQSSSRSKSEKFPLHTEKTAIGFPLEPPPPPPPRHGQEGSSRGGGASPVVENQLLRSSLRKGGKDDEIPPRPPLRPPSRSSSHTRQQQQQPHHQHHQQHQQQHQQQDYDVSSSTTSKFLVSRHQTPPARLNSVPQPDLFYSNNKQQQQAADSNAVPYMKEASTVHAVHPPSYGERMYHSGPLLASGGFSSNVDIEDLLEEHEKKLKQAVRRAVAVE